MITLESVSARRAPLALASVTLAWTAGTHAIVGSHEDGGVLLLALIAGLARPRSGPVRVLGATPTQSSVRRQIAFVPLETALPDAIRVREVIGLAAAIRQEPAGDETKRLALLGIEPLVDRPVRSLSRAEARAVALAEAVSSTTVRVLLVEEPYVAMDPRAVSRVASALRARAHDGCAVVVATASMREAHELADELVCLRRGAVVSPAECADVHWEGTDGSPVAVSVVLRDADGARSLMAALAGEADIEAIERSAGNLRLRGQDAMAIARAAARAAIDAGTDIAELRIEGRARTVPQSSSAGSAGRTP